ncbi:hypothetical protein EJP82_27800 [Paenibacillus anaericanus]|uniref:Uncharacterized protein n=1 Tax=Paenibacillus anaericanus TaxID=170367 RepID=A0A3S1DGJ9_9BACL|nr:hypothetical protein [Paenibacillus anaericanus]RUT37713.1 hypothetical protein EJP82_27800 [Paenibacillus anaericanus]
MDSIKISIPHFYCLEYSEGDKTMFVDIDFRESRILFGVSLIKEWNEPYKKEIITPEYKKKIADNIISYLLKSYKPEDIMEIS